MPARGWKSVTIKKSTHLFLTELSRKEGVPIYELISSRFRSKADDTFLYGRSKARWKLQREQLMVRIKKSRVGSHALPFVTALESIIRNTDLIFEE